MLNLAPETENRVYEFAARVGVDPDEAINRLLSTFSSPIASALPGELPALTRLKALRRLSAEDRDLELREETLAVADLINADLARPTNERELTALTALDGVDLLDLGEAS